MLFRVGASDDTFGTIELSEDGGATLTPEPGFEEQLAERWRLLAGSGEALLLLRHQSSPGRGYPFGAWAERLADAEPEPARPPLKSPDARGQYIKEPEPEPAKEPEKPLAVAVAEALTPALEAMAKMQQPVLEALAKLALAKSEPPRITVNPTIQVPEPKPRKQRAFKITHDDGTESTVSEE